jgi:hypothetical protein
MMNTTTPELIDWQPGQQAKHNGNVVTLITSPTSSGYTPARLGHHCGLGTDCRRWDVDGGATAFAWECELSPVADQPTQDSADFPHVGAEMTWASPDGRITITVRRGHFTWTVETYQGTLRVSDNCGAYGSEGEARAVARGYATMYRAEHSTSAPARLRSTPVAKGHQLDMSPSQAIAIVLAGVGGTIDRGASAVGGVPTGRLTDTQIRAAAERGWVRPLLGEGRRRRIVGCQPTPTGWAHAKAMQATNPATTDVVA